LRCNALLSHHTGQPLERIERDVERDYFMTAEAAKEYGVIDQIIPEPLGGAQRGRAEAIAAVGKAVEAELKALKKRQKGDALMKERREKFLKMGSKGLAA